MLLAAVPMMRSLLGAGPQRKLGTMLDTSAEERDRMAAREDRGAAPSQGLRGVSIVPVPGEQNSMLAVLLLPQCQGEVNGLNAISGAQSVYPHKHPPKEDIYPLITQNMKAMLTVIVR